ncbi:MAG: DUF4124 domain-containing protein [Curvibacter sp.]|nr:DUF4124 domain-containing protein [Curvibacter sp.]
MRPISYLLAGALLLSGTTAFAQWIWLDRDGHKVFSDRAPPPEVPLKNVLKQPGVAATPAAPATPPAAADAPADAATTAAKAANGGNAGGPLDKAVEERKKKAAADEAEKKRADEARVAQQKAANCAQAQQAKANLDSGMRIAQVNANGERVILDDAARQAEIDRAQASINANCQ